MLPASWQCLCSVHHVKQILICLGKSDYQREGARRGIGGTVSWGRQRVGGRERFGLGRGRGDGGEGIYGVMEDEGSGDRFLLGVGRAGAGGVGEERGGWQSTGKEGRYFTTAGKPLESPKLFLHSPPLPLPHPLPAPSPHLQFHPTFLPPPHLQLIMGEQYQRTMQESRQLAQRMRNGTGAALLLHAQDAPTHRIDSLERFQKDFASHEKMRREQEKWRRQSQLQRRRVQVLDRQNKRWQQVESYDNKIKEREEYSAVNQVMGAKRVANSNGLAYNPITLEYDRNPEGDKLRRLDEEATIRRYVRAHNMDHNGNSKYNPLNGEYRRGIEAVIPLDLNDRFEQKKYEHYDNLRLRVPSSASHDQPHPYSKYY